MRLLLDLDGTLIDSFSRHGLLLEKLLRQYAPDAQIQTAEYIEIKRSGKNNYQYLTQYLNLPENTARSVRDEWIRQIEHNVWLEHDKLYDDAKPFLERAKTHGDEIIFLSARQNAANVQSELKRFGLDYFANDIIIVNKNAEYKTKSDYIRHILSNTRQSSLQQPSKYDTIVVGDTEDDFNAALANQIPSFILSRGFRSPTHLARVLKIPKSFDSLTEVSKRIYEQ